MREGTRSLLAADAMDKPLTDQELAQQYEQQLAAGIEERRALRLRLKQVRGVLQCRAFVFSALGANAHHQFRPGVAPHIRG